ncbi:MAG: hypothetical protein OHK0046_37310 [Anaerolineae bacterium]
MVAVQSVPNAATITREVLDNGVTILVYENFTSPSVVLTGSFHAGSIYDPGDKTGLAALTASALMMGTQSHDFDALHARLEDIGADLGIGAATHRASFNGKALAEDLPVLVDLLAQSLRTPVFPEDHVERLRGERITWLQYSQQDTRWLAARQFREMLYPPHHPYHYSTRGTLETLPTFTLEDVRTFHRHHYGPRGLVIAIVGAVKAEKAVTIVRQALGDWQNPEQPPFATLPDIKAPVRSVRTAETVAGKTQTDVVIGTLGPSRFAEDYMAASLANSVLGVFGMMGRVGDVVREREGMAYYAYSRLEGGTGPGSWSISAGVNPLNLERAIDLATQEIRRLTEEPISAEDLADNQAYFTGRLPLQLESNEGLAGTLHSMEIFELGLDYLLRYRDMVYSLTVDAVQQAARRYLNPDALVMGVAGP